MNDYDREYAATSDLFGAEPEPMLVNHVHLLRGTSVLDVGCGQGRHALWLARRGLRVTALDPSTEAVRTVAQAAAEQTLPITTVHGDVADVERPAQAFAAICVFGLLQILDPAGVADLVAAVDRWTGPGSLLFLTAWTTADPSHATVSTSWERIGPGSYRHADGRVRTYLQPGAVLAAFSGWRPIHHREAFGPWHRHGDDGELQRHGMVELVAERP